MEAQYIYKGMVQGDTVPCPFSERRLIMDMYTDNNGGFQVLEGMPPFDDGYQVQGADGFVSEPYQETAAEYGSAACMEEADALPVGPGQILETGDSGLYQDMVSEICPGPTGRASASSMQAAEPYSAAVS